MAGVAEGDLLAGRGDVGGLIDFFNFPAGAEFAAAVLGQPVFRQDGSAGDGAGVLGGTAFRQAEVVGMGAVVDQSGLGRLGVGYVVNRGEKLASDACLEGARLGCGEAASNRIDYGALCSALLYPRLEAAVQD